MKIIEGSMAAAIAAQQAKPGVIPFYPITPATHIPEYLTQFKADGYLNSEMIEMESEHSVMSAAIGAQATGVRTFTATSSQGLALMNEMLHIASGLRLPIVMVNVNRALSSPINIWNDMQDSISARDTGWIQLYAENNQEVYDLVLQAFKIAEKALIPVMVCMDGFVLSHMNAPVSLLKQSQVDKFVGKYNPYVELDVKKPVTIGPISFPDTYMEFKQAQQEAIVNSKKIITDVGNSFKKSFKRKYGLIETYNMEKSKHAVIAMGSVCGTIKYALPKDTGLIKIISFRPFPNEELKKFSKLKSIAVIDKDVSFGNHGALYTEVCATLHGPKISGFIAGLGGRDITPDHIKKAIDISKKREVQEEWLN